MWNFWAPGGQINHSRFNEILWLTRKQNFKMIKTKAAFCVQTDDSISLQPGIINENLQNYNHKTHHGVDEPPRRVSPLGLQISFNEGLFFTSWATGEARGTFQPCLVLGVSWPSLVMYVLLLQPTPVFLPGESQVRGSLVGCHLWGRTGSNMTEAT